MIIRAKGKQSVVRDWVRFRSAWLGSNGRWELPFPVPPYPTHLARPTSPRGVRYSKDDWDESASERVFLRKMLIPQNALHRLSIGHHKMCCCSQAQWGKQPKIQSLFPFFFLNLEPSVRPKTLRMLITFFRSKRTDGLGNDRVMIMPTKPSRNFSPRS